MTITSLGIGTNGLDLESLLSKQVAAESIPLQQLQTQTQTLQTKFSAYGQIKSGMTNLQTALQALTNPSTWSAVTATSSDTASVAVTAGDGATAGNVTVAVSQLATAQTLASSAYGSTTASTGAGSITIQLGKWGANQGSFTPGSTGAVTINIASGSDSLTSVRDQINAANAGVTASIVTDSSGSRLVMRGNTTGQSSGFQVTVNDADGNNSDASGLSALAYDPSNGVSSMVKKTDAANALAVINGLDVESESNTLDSVIPGLTMTLNKVTSNASISVAQNTDSIQTAVKTFAQAYNAIAQLFAADTKYDAGTKVAGPLQGDSAAVGLQYMMRSIAGSSTNLGGAFTRLADIGLDPQADGTLKVDATKLASAVGNTKDLKSFFMGVDSSTASNSGLGQQLSAFVNGALSIDGQLTSATTGLQTRIDNSNKRQDDLQAHIDLYSQRLRDRYNLLDTQMASLNSLASYVSQQMTILNNNA